ncbi:hypothetical protein Cob_v002383 [Colletotrichum orbiculare MAFF 240422]|uniref:Uncharacterized protein n=1 Tax=Colletotrichum orbiculare (strain 104-T / ATCC 96160 / CBS 514.97 / LARS 414 / MAFF 240422) TaxID=1213857 RepID=A0A484G3B6_COLOR|nr:hypothetical protein Cob_v002383 [Colletotrichum orbiculare MAFF 240422]
MADAANSTSDTVKAGARSGRRSQDKDGISTSSAFAGAGAETKPAPPPEPEASGWFHWHEPGTSPEEKRLIFKLDFVLLSFSCLMYFIKQACSHHLQ